MKKVKETLLGGLRLAGMVVASYGVIALTITIVKSFVWLVVFVWTKLPF